jgi:hypothetical protein
MLDTEIRFVNLFYSMTQPDKIELRTRRSSLKDEETDMDLILWRHAEAEDT